MFFQNICFDWISFYFSLHIFKFKLGHPDTCVTCWNEEDIANYYYFPARASYSRSALEHRDTTEPFEYVETKCVLKCDQDYHYSSYGKFWLVDNG